VSRAKANLRLACRLSFARSCIHGLATQVLAAPAGVVLEKSRQHAAATAVVAAAAAEKHVYSHSVDSLGASPFLLGTSLVVLWVCHVVGALRPSTHRRRRRDASVELRRVGCVHKIRN